MIRRNRREAARRNGPHFSLLLVAAVCCLAGSVAAAAEPVTLTVHGWRVTIGENSIELAKAGSTPTPGPVVPGPVVPGPTPPPGPTPAPELPEGVFGAAKQARQWALEVTSPTRTADCLAVAEACETVAADAAAGKLEGLVPGLTAQNVATAFLAEITRRLGNEGQRPWLSFGDKMGAVAKAAFLANKLSGGKEWAVFLREIAAGLRAAK